MNFNFDFSDRDNDYYNMYNVSAQTQVKQLRMIELLENIWFTKDEFIDIEVPQVFSLTAKTVADLTKVYDLNKIGKYDGAMLFKYMNNKFYVWKKYLSGVTVHIQRKDNVQMIESIIMGNRFDAEYDEQKTYLPDWLRDDSSSRSCFMMDPLTAAGKFIFFV